MKVPYAWSHQTDAGGIPATGMTTGTTVPSSTSCQCVTDMLIGHHLLPDFCMACLVFK